MLLDRAMPMLAHPLACHFEDSNKPFARRLSLDRGQASPEHCQIMGKAQKVEAGAACNAAATSFPCFSFAHHTRCRGRARYLDVVNPVSSVPAFKKKINLDLSSSSPHASFPSSQTPVGQLRRLQYLVISRLYHSALTLAPYASRRHYSKPCSLPAGAGAKLKVA